jgi:predicted transcriptional regulator
MDIITTLRSIGLPETAARVYFELLTKSNLTARQLADLVGVSRPSVYDHLKILMNAGLVVEMTRDDKTYFVTSDQRNLTNYIDEHIQTLALGRENLEKEIPKLRSSDESNEPRVKFYAGVEGVKRVLQDMLWRQNIETFTMWPMTEMLEILGADYLRELNKKRIRNKISVRGIWPYGNGARFKETPFLGVGGGHLRQTRYAPKGLKWDMSYWLYEDKVAFISSSKERFALLVQSKDLVSLMKTNFEVLWHASTPVKPEPKYTDPFLKEIGVLK